MWEDNIKVDLRERGQESGLDSPGTRQGPVVGACKHSNESFGFIKGLAEWLLASQAGLCSMHLYTQPL